MSRSGHLPERKERSFPRVSGDEPESSMSTTDLQRFSPRERG